jgi:hypothetical protein
MRRKPPARTAAKDPYPDPVFERFTPRARRVLVLAQEEARLLNHTFIGTEHILLGLIHEGEGLAAKALEGFGISLEAVREKVEVTIGPSGSAPTGSPPFTPRAKKVLELSFREALQLGHDYISTEHILLGLVREGEGVAAQVLQALGADLGRVRQQVIQLLSGHQDEQSSDVIDRATDQPRLNRLSEPLFGGHPRRILAGPKEELVAEGIHFRVVGVSNYTDSVEVFWRLSGIPGALTELFNDAPVDTRGAEYTPNAARSGYIRSGYVALSDGSETNYANSTTAIELERDGTVAGSSVYFRSLPDDAKSLVFEWQGQRLTLDL